MRVIVSAGGTGGHIYPALAIISEIKEKDKNSEILYIGSNNRMEKTIVPASNIPFYGIDVYGIDRKHLIKNIRTMRYFSKAVKKAKKKIKEFKPDIVIGVGGYVSAPVVYAASKMGIKTIIHEQNSVLGMTNKFLSKYVDAVATSLPDTKVKAKKVVYTGNPSIVDNSLKFDRKEYGLSNNKKLVLIVMGSLGSKTVNNKLKTILKSFNSKIYEVLLVTGRDYYDEFKNLKLSSNIIVVPFINNLKRVLSEVDVLVSRAGATTISEIISYRVPSILVPSPYVTDNHQYKNAMSLVNANAALLVEESDIDTKLAKYIDKLINDEKTKKTLKSNLEAFDTGDSKAKIYSLIKRVVNGK